MLKTETESLSEECFENLTLPNTWSRNMDALPSNSREPLGGTLRKHVLPLIAGQLKTPRTRASGSAPPQMEMSKSTEVALVVNGPDDLPPSIVGRPSRETFPGNWIQSPKAFGTIEGRKHDRQGSLSTQGSNEYPESRKTREMDSSPIQESISNSSEESERQELARTIELGVEIMPDDPQVAMSHATAMARIATMLKSSRTNLSSTTGVTKTAPNQPISSTSYQSTQRSNQGGSTGFGQPLTPVTPPEGPPEGQLSEQSPQGSPGRPAQVAAPQQAVQTPHGTDGTMKGQPPIIFDGERSKGSQFMAEFQNW